MSDDEQEFEDKVLSRVAEGDPLMTAAYAIVRGANLIEAIRPEVAKATRARFHKYARELRGCIRRNDRKKLLTNLAGLRDALIVIADVIREHKIADVEISTQELADGFLQLANDLDEWGKPSAAPMIWPFLERDVVRGMSVGLSVASYDVRIAESVTIHPGEFVLASTMERFCIPNDVLIVAHDKSSWARRGLAVQNTIFDPGWRGYASADAAKLAAFDAIIGYKIRHEDK
jgi:hypothetical protein